MPTYVFPPSFIPRAPELTTGPSAPPSECPGESGDKGPGSGNLPPDAPAEEDPNGDPKEDPATSRKKGSFYSDQKGKFYSLEWANFAEFDAWRRAEEAAHCIEFRASTVWQGGALWTRQRLYVCGRQVTGGGTYTKKHPNRKRKIESKKFNCPCRIRIKFYPHTTTILGNYREEHNHKTGRENIQFLGISREVWERVKALLKQKVDRRQIVRTMYATAPELSRERFISPKYVNRWAREVEHEEIRLHPEDATSVKLWVDRLQSNNVNLYLKDKASDPPLGSDLDKKTFILCIQTPFQLDAFRRLGNGFIGIDATHNVTQYSDFLLFTIIARDRWGHGVPIAWMLSSNGTTETISFFLNWVKEASPAVRPAVIMTDRDQAQIKAIEKVYSDSRVLLCLWHVLRAFRSHIVTEEFGELWEKVKSWVRTEDSDEFQRIWAEISIDPSVPQSFVKYLATDWMPRDHMWSLSKRTERSLLEEGNTNMLIEAYHHVLKTHFLDGKRNRRIDHIIWTLVMDMVPYFEARHERQAIGVEGKDLVEQRRQEILESAEAISRDSIQAFDDTQFHVASVSCPGEFYAIDLARQICDCKDFHRIEFCKHIAAIYLHFPDLCPEVGSQTNVAQSPKALSIPQTDSKEEIKILRQEIAVLSQTLAAQDQSASSPAQVEAHRSAKHSLTALITSSQDLRPLPEKEYIAPNQKTWKETADRMGVPRTQKKKRLPEERGITDRTIGAAKGKRRREYDDPYAGGERSGKRAKPDALSVEANLRACASTSRIGTQSLGAVFIPAFPLPASLPPASLPSASFPSMSFPSASFPSASLPLASLPTSLPPASLPSLPASLPLPPLSDTQHRTGRVGASRAHLVTQLTR